MTRSLFSSETLTLFWDKTSELTSEASCHIQFSDSNDPAHLRTAYLIVRAGGVTAGGCMFTVTVFGIIRGVWELAEQGSFGVQITSASVGTVTAIMLCFPFRIPPDDGSGPARSARSVPLLREPWREQN